MRKTILFTSVAATAMFVSACSKPAEAPAATAEATTDAAASAMDAPTAPASEEPTAGSTSDPYGSSSGHGK